MRRAASLALALTACTCGGSVATSQSVTPDLNFSTCVLVTSATDIAAGKTSAQAADDSRAMCGGTRDTVAAVLDAAAKRDAILFGVSQCKDGGS